MSFFFKPNTALVSPLGFLSRFVCGDQNNDFNVRMRSPPQHTRMSLSSCTISTLWGIKSSDSFCVIDLTNLVCCLHPRTPRWYIHHRVALSAREKGIRGSEDTFLLSKGMIWKFHIALLLTSYWPNLRHTSVWSFKRRWEIQSVFVIGMFPNKYSITWRKENRYWGIVSLLPFPCLAHNWLFLLGCSNLPFLFSP